MMMMMMMMIMMVFILSEIMIDALHKESILPTWRTYSGVIRLGKAQRKRPARQECHMGPYTGDSRREKGATRGTRETREAREARESKEARGAREAREGRERLLH